MNFLDQPELDRTHPDAIELVEVLEARFWKKSQEVYVLAQRAGIKRGWINWDQPMTDVWWDMVERAATEGCLRKLVAEFAQLTDVEAHRTLLERLLSPGPTQIYQPPNEFAMLLFGPKFRRPFIDRAILRQHLQDMCAPGGPRILVVTGDSGSGKSFTWHLVSHLQAVHGFDARKIDLDMWSPEPARPIDVMIQIADVLGLEHRPRVDENATASTQAKLLVGWLIGQIAADSTERWIVIDGLDRPAVRQSVLHLAERLAEASENRELGEVRVVLIGFPSVLAAGIDRLALREELRELTASDLRTFFLEVYDHLGGPADPDVIDGLVEFALQNIATETFMPLEIAQAVGDSVDLMLEQAT